MTSYKTTFSQLDRAALIPFFVLGDPDEKTSMDLIKTAIDAGADILELGIPFSDPIADGPTIQKADIRALQAGMTPRKALDLIAQISAYKAIPIGLLVYYNLIYHYGVEQFFKDFKRAGGTSVLVADISIDDADEIAPVALSAGLETVFMVTTNTSDERLKQIVQKTTGFIYTVSLLGTTGQRNALSGAVKPLVAKLKKMTNKPVCVGFGISSAEHAAEVAAAGADGVIIGSRVVKIIEDNPGNPEQMKRQIADFVTLVHKALGKA